MIIENAAVCGPADTKAALDRAARDLSAAETELNHRRSQLTSAEAAVDAAVQRGAATEEIARACERRLTAKDDSRRAARACDQATRFHSKADRAHDHACVRDGATRLVEKWSASAANLAADYESAAQTIVGAMAADLLIVQAAERANRHHEAFTPTRGWLVAADFTSRLSLPRLSAPPAGGSGYFWYPGDPLDNLKNAPPGAPELIASLKLGAPLTGPEEFDGFARRIAGAENQFFELYNRTAARLAERLSNEWFLRREIDAGKRRCEAAGMASPILPKAWPGTLMAIVCAVPAALPKLATRREYHLIQHSAS